MQGAVLEENRDRLRQAALSQRRALALADCLAWSRSIQSRAMEFSYYRAARAVGLYSPVQNEVDTSAILQHALTSNKQVFYPKLSLPGSAALARVNSASELVVGRHDILEPAGSDFLAPVGCDSLVLFIPGVLFDRRGNRLGRGGGWYDRLLGELVNNGIVVGLAYESQLVERLPAERWDRRVHFILTEKNQIDCGIKSH
jgi:5-formyltetrahydrofolate cyclo-ligase